MDATYPGKVQLHRVNFNAVLPHEVTQNYKVLQQIFDKCNVQKNIDVGQLQRGTFQDNLEFLQWLKHYHDVNTTLRPGEYKARERRKACSCSEPKGAIGRHGVKRPVSTKTTRTVTSTTTADAAPEKRQRLAAKQHGATTAAPKNAAATKNAPAAAKQPRPAPKESTTAEEVEEIERAAQSICEGVTVQQYANMKFELEDMERERDFYYGKLRAVEDLCQETLAQQTEAEAAAEDTHSAALKSFVNQVMAIL